MLQTASFQYATAATQGAAPALGLEFGNRRCQISGMAQPQLQSTLTCPHCGHQAMETMPLNACLAFYDCKGCGKTLKPLPGTCCVFCSYGSVPCPPIQQGVEPCCNPIPDKRSQDWLSNARASLLAWWGPTLSSWRVYWQVRHCVALRMKRRNRSESIATSPILAGLNCGRCYVLFGTAVGQPITNELVALLIDGDADVRKAGRTEHYL